MELKIIINGQEQVYKGMSKKSCILKCLENNAALSDCFFANKGIIAAIEAGRDINKKEAEAAFAECVEDLRFEWIIPNGGTRENAGRKSKGYKMVSIRMTEDEKEKVKEFLRLLRHQI